MSKPKPKTKAKKRSFLSSKRITVAVSMAFLAIMALNAFPGDKPLPHRNPVDLGTSLHPGKFVSQSMVVTDERFKHVAFADIPAQPRGFYSQVAGVFEALKHFSLNLFGLSKNEAKREHGSWIWTPMLVMTPQYIEGVLSGAKENGVNVMYVSVDSYLDIYAMKEGEEKRELEKKFTETLDYFIESAGRRNISVDAEAGWQNWAEEGNEYKAVAVVEYVKKFNETRENKFRGFQYDVEPYLLDKFKTDPASVLSNFTRLIDRTENSLKGSSLRFSVVIPDYYDKKDEATPEFAYNGRNDFAFGHLIKILNERPDNSVIVMSYRNFADGEDGSIEVSKNEMGTAKKKTNRTKVIIAQEVGGPDPKICIPILYN